jgi:hypothetical protein
MEMVLAITVLIIATGLYQDEVTYRTKAWLVVVITLVVLLTYMAF